MANEDVQYLLQKVHKTNQGGKKTPNDLGFSSGTTIELWGPQKVDPLIRVNCSN